ncbi:MAG: MFS transporter, partial [Bacteroidota bacterium]
MLQTINKSPWLIGIYLVGFMDRFVYYGLRASLVIYAIDDTGLGMEGIDALELIGYVYLASLVGSGIGAILQDYVFKSPSGTMLGAGLIIIGATILTLMPESSLFWVAVFTLIFGSGILRIGLDTLVARLYLKQDSSRVFGYLGQNVAISFGAALGIIIIGYLGEEVEYRYAFYLIGLLALLITGVAQILFARLPILEVKLSPVFQDESSSSILDDGFVNKKSSISAFTWAFTFAFFMQIFAFCFGWVEQASLEYYETLTTGHWGFLAELERGIISFVAFLIGIGGAFVLFSKTWSWPIWRYGSLSFFSLFLGHILITQIPLPILDETFGLVALSFICL